jgi:hypothetical protein
LATLKREKSTKLEPVAVKILRLSATAADKEDFLGEAEIMLSLDHPKLLKVYELITSWRNLS